MNYTIFFILFVIITDIIGFIEIIINTRRREPGKIYYKWLFPVILMFFILVLITTFIEYFTIRREINYIIVGFGLGLLVVRFLLKYWSIKSLGKYWCPQLEIRENHKLIKEGPYRYLRHPGYLSTIVDIIIFPLLANAYFTLMFSFFIYIILLYVRIFTEEKVLLEIFGEEYIEYKRNTWALLPYVY